MRNHQVTTATPPKQKIRVPVEEFTPHYWHAQLWNDKTHRFKIICWHRRSRKTTYAINRLITACCSNPNHTYGYIAPTYKQAKSIVWRDPMMLRRYLPEQLLAKPFNESELFAEFWNGSMLVVKGGDDPDSLRGINFNGVVFDEWAKFKKPDVFDEIIRAVLAQNKGWAEFPFTPKGRNHAWDFYRRGGKPGWEDWTTFTLTASQSGLISKDELDRARREMGEDFYRQEFECEFLEDVHLVFRGLELCVVGELRPPISGRRYVMGIDLGRHHDATVLSVLDVVDRHLVAFERMTEAHWSLQKKAIAALSLRYNKCPVIIDSTGFSAGDPIAEDLQNIGVSVEPFQFTEASKRMLVDGLRVGIAQRLLTFPKIPQLIQELEEFEFKLKPDGSPYDPPRYGAPEGEGYFDDCVFSLALGVHGLKGDLYVQHGYDQEEIAAVIEDILPNQGYSFS